MSIMVERLSIFPIKSCGALELRAMRLDDRGPLLDRHWLIVDANGAFVTQRQTAKLAQVQLSLVNNVLRASAPGMGMLELADVSDWSQPQPIAKSTTARKQIKIWRDELSALLWSDHADAWFSQVVGKPCHLVAADRSLLRKRTKGDPPVAYEVKFPDSAPILMINRQSVAALQSMSGLAPLDELRFRANIVVDGLTAFEEDGWTTARVGSIPFSLLYPCDRCTMINIDQHTAQIDKTVLATLAKHRGPTQSINFGMRMVHAQVGEIRIGDLVVGV